MGVLTVVKVKIAPRGLLPSFTDGQMVMFCYAVRLNGLSTNVDPAADAFCAFIAVSLLAQGGCNLWHRVDAKSCSRTLPFF